MAGGEVKELSFGGWIPVNTESGNPSLTLVHNPPVSGPSQEILDFPFLVEQPEQIRREPANAWQKSFLEERQQNGGLFPLQLTIRELALGGVLLSLLITAIIGTMNSCLICL